MSLSLPSTRHPIVRLLRAEHRRLAGSRPLALACSGGADSSALAIAAAAAKLPAVIIHVQHDLRPLDLASRDAAATIHLAQTLQIPAKLLQVSTPKVGNSEALARSARYTALTRACDDLGLSCIATAHHAGDQYESVIAACVSGGGLAALAGIAPRRWARRPNPSSRTPGVLLIRPLLTVDPRDLRELCRASGWIWQEDHTNLDPTRLRSALRHRVLPAIEAAGRPATGQYAGTAAIATKARALLLAERRQIRQILQSLGEVVPRSSIVTIEPSLRSGVLRAWLLRQCSSLSRRDLGAKRLDPIIAAICDHNTHPRTWHVPVSKAAGPKDSTSRPSSAQLILQAQYLTLQAPDASQATPDTHFFK